MDPISTIKHLVRAARTVMSIIKEVNENREEAISLGQRVSRLMVILDQYESTSSQSMSTDMINSLQDVLSQSAIFLRKFVPPSSRFANAMYMVKSVVNRSRIATKFAEIQSRLDRINTDLAVHQNAHITSKVDAMADALQQ